MDLQEGIDAYETGDYTRARDLFQEAITAGLRADDRVRAGIYLGNALQRLGDPHGANEQFRIAIALDPAPDERRLLHYKLGASLRRMGYHEAARVELGKAGTPLGSYPTRNAQELFVYALTELAALDDDQGNYAAALACVERATSVPIVEEPKNTPILLELTLLRGKALFWLRRWDETILVLKDATARLSQSAPDVRHVMLCYLGLALSAMHMWDEAFSALRGAELDPVAQPFLWAATRVWLGNIYYLRSDFCNALREYEAILSRPVPEWAGSRDSLARMADCYIETGHLEQGLEVAARAYGELRGNSLVHVEYARALGFAGRYQEAQRVLDEIGEDTVDPGMRERYFAVATAIATGNDRMENAVYWLRRLEGVDADSRYLPSLRTSMARRRQ